jgi:hypothetical protein
MNLNKEHGWACGIGRGSAGSGRGGGGLALQDNTWTPSNPASLTALDIAVRVRKKHELTRTRIRKRKFSTLDFPPALSCIVMRLEHSGRVHA